VDSIDAVRAVPSSHWSNAALHFLTEKLWQVTEQFTTTIHVQVDDTNHARMTMESSLLR